MAGFDQRADVVLADATERIYSTEEGVEEVPLGLYLVKGDQVYVSRFLGRIYPALDDSFYFLEMTFYSGVKPVCRGHCRKAVSPLRPCQSVYLLPPCYKCFGCQFLF